MIKRLKPIFFGLVLLLISAFPAFASIESIKSFNSDITIHKDGSIDVVENIEYDFGFNQKHGIFRNIPLTNTNNGVSRRLDISVISVFRNEEFERYVVSNTGDNLEIKIGKAESMISGINDYEISYKVVNSIGNFDDHDEIYWNITGTEWEVPINSATALVKTDFETSITNATCFTGGFGSKDKRCDFVKRDEGEFFQTTKALGSSEGLTIVAGFPPNTFPKSKISVAKEPIKISPQVYFVIFLLISVLVVLYYIFLPYFVLRWYLKHRHKSRFGKPAVNFDIPKDNKGKRLLPAEAGVMDTARLDRDDVIATIFDLAIRKYIFIEQTEKKKNILGLGGKKDFVVKKKKDYQDLTTFEKTLLDRLFKNGNSVALSSLSTDFYATFNSMQANIFALLIKERFYKENPQNKRAVYAGIGFAAIVFLFNLPLAFVMFWMLKTYNGRTDLGDEADFRIDGLKLFLGSMSRQHKWYANQLALVEQMIPYSIALGYIDKFMEQLKISYPDYDPSWYKGNLGFYVATNSMFNSMNSGFTTNTPSRSSGFSKGGFSGGGGGGGGGGSW